MKPEEIRSCIQQAFVAIVTSHTQAYPQPRNQPAPTSVAQPALSAITAVESVGMTVADMDRAIASLRFFSQNSK